MIALLLISLLSPSSVPLDVRAERMEFDQASGRVVFEGAVQLNQGRMVLRCARLTAKMEAACRAIGSVLRNRIIASTCARAQVRRTCVRACGRMCTGHGHASG